MQGPNVRRRARTRRPRPSSSSRDVAGCAGSLTRQRDQDRLRLVGVGELAEIDENVMRNEPSEFELAQFLARRKELYEQLYPKTKAGAAQAAGMNRQLGNNVAVKSAATSFGADAAAKTGMTDREIRRATWRANNIAPAVKAENRGNTEDRQCRRRA